MDDQSAVIRYTMNSFLRLIQTFGKSRKPLKVRFWDNQKEDIDCCYIVFLNVKETKQDNMMNRLRVQKPGKGNVEILVKPPLKMGLTFAVVFQTEDVLRRLELLGGFYKFIRDNKNIPVEDFNWVGNEGQPLLLHVIDNDEGTSLPDGLKEYAPYTVTLFTEIGIDSPVGEEVKQVRQRSFSAIHKAE